MQFLQQFGDPLQAPGHVLTPPGVLGMARGEIAPHREGLAALRVGGGEPRDLRMLA